MDPRVQRWLERDPDPETRRELEELVALENTREIERRFAGRLEFGTAGLRGLLGAGPLRMNRLVVQETTAGLGAYLLEQVPSVKERGVVIGYDGRRGSLQFARDAATVLTALGIRVFLGDRVLPTPVCAFAVEHLGAAAGVMVTASHNPPDYNGYKVYWSNAAQIIPPHDAGIAAAIDAAVQAPIPWCEVDEGQPPWETIGEPLMAAYLAEVKKLSIHPETPARRTYPLAYTPLHGVGAEAVERALAQAGFETVRTVASQREPDGNFPTVSFPNPEEPGAMDAVLALAEEMGAALALANDPDADRLAVAVRDAQGRYQMLSGNQIGVLLGADRIENAGHPVTVATTIVSSRMLGAIARANGGAYFETLTGFKWIANGALARRDRGDSPPFVFGYEEALGYTIGELVRDKDGVSALVAFAELAVHLESQGQTVLQRLEELYRRYGLYLATQRTLALDPLATGPSLGDRLRQALPATIAGRKVVGTDDLSTGVRVDATGKTSRLDLPPSDVLVFVLDDDSRVIVRPSGTEPKIKCYYEGVGTIEGDFTAAQQSLEERLHQLADTHQKELASL